MIEWDNTVTWVKTVKDYSGRKRINITKSDGIDADTDVVILLKDDYNDLIADYDRLLQMEKDLNNQKVTAETIGDKFIEPLKTSYDDIIDGLKADLKAKDDIIDRLKLLFHDYDKQVYNLGLLDILRHENRKLSDDVNSKIWITGADDRVTDADVVKLTDGESQD